jgi:hypothetical protein
MSHANPTPLRIGASGTLNGWRVTVAGRVVLGVRDGGETYYWNEFNLVDDTGNAATLVFEETEHGPEWKLFRPFTPVRPMDARAAAAIKVGDTVHLDGNPVQVTLTGTSRVYHIEGTAPEGVQVGDIASYFNADTGSRMLVASWTGTDIEFYEGLDAPADTLATAFGLPRTSFNAVVSNFSPGGSSNAAASSGWVSKVVFMLIAASSVFGAYSCFSTRASGTSSAPRPKLAAPATRLADGAAGSLAQQRYVVAAHAVVEVARVSGRHDRREYVLRTDADDEVLLVNGLSGGAKEWHLLRPIVASPTLTPYEAATQRRGTTLRVDGGSAKIIDLFQSRATAADGVRSSDTLQGVVQYGFVAQDGPHWIVARWTEDRIRWHRGTALPDTEVLSALGQAK